MASFTVNSQCGLLNCCQSVVIRELTAVHTHTMLTGIRATIFKDMHKKNDESTAISGTSMMETAQHRAIRRVSTGLA